MLAESRAPVGGAISLRVGGSTLVNGVRASKNPRRRAALNGAAIAPDGTGQLLALTAVIGDKHESQAG